MSMSDLKETFDKGMNSLLNDLKSLSTDLKNYYTNLKQNLIKKFPDYVQKTLKFQTTMILISQWKLILLNKMK